MRLIGVNNLRYFDDEENEEETHLRKMKHGRATCRARMTTNKQPITEETRDGQQKTHRGNRQERYPGGVVVFTLTSGDGKGKRQSRKLRHSPVRAKL